MARTIWSARHVQRPFLRLGLRLSGVGCVFGVLFSAHKVLYYANVGFGGRLPWDESGAAGIQLFLLGPAVILLIAGIPVPYCGPRISLPRRRRAIYQRLGPLREALRATTPDAATVEAGSLRGTQERLLNRIVGIRDALIGPLRPFLDARVYDQARVRAIQLGLQDKQAQ